MTESDLFEAIKTNPNSPENNTLFDFEELQQTKMKFFKLAQLIISNFINNKLHLEQLNILYLFLNSKQNIIILKKVDHSFIVQKFNKYNQLLIDFLTKNNSVKHLEIDFAKSGLLTDFKRTYCDTYEVSINQCEVKISVLA